MLIVSVVFKLSAAVIFPMWGFIFVSYRNSAYYCAAYYCAAHCACEAAAAALGVGAEGDFTLGGRHDPAAGGPPLTVRVRDLIDLVSSQISYLFTARLTINSI